MEIRKVYAPFSLSGENTGTTPVEGYIDVNQAIYPAIDTGFVDTKGRWNGRVSSDSEFTIGALAEAIPNTGEVLFPSISNLAAIDMTGFNDMFIALFPTNAGNFAISAIMGPSDSENQFANLSPVDPAALLKGSNALQGQGDDFNSLLSDSSQALSADVWNIFYINNSLKAQKNLQFKVVNNSGGESDINFAFMRVV